MEISPISKFFYIEDFDDQVDPKFRDDVANGYF